MPGFQEILILILILGIIFFLPRLMGNKKQTKPAAKIPSLSGGLRLGIVISIIFPAGAALVIQPWQKNLIPFIAIGFFPVALGWGLFWVLTGFKNRKN